MAKTPEEKIGRTAAKATDALRSMLDQAIRLRDGYDEAFVEDRLPEGADRERLDAAAAGLRTCLVRLAGIIARLELADGPRAQAEVFVGNEDIAETSAAALQEALAVPPPPVPDKERQVLVLKRKVNEWGELHVPMDPEELGEALSSKEWREKARRAVAGTRERLTHLQDKGGAKELDQVLDRIQAAIQIEDEAAGVREQANKLEAAVEMRRRWVELDYFGKNEAYLAADAEGLSKVAGPIRSLAAMPGAEGLHEKASELLAAWKRRHRLERRAENFALQGSVYDHTVARQQLPEGPNYVAEIAAILEQAGNLPEMGGAS